MWKDILVGIGFMLMLEGLFPFMNPKAWKELVKKMSEQSDQVLQRIGLVCVLLGLIIVYCVRG